jgi:hypothetical protein
MVQYVVYSREKLRKYIIPIFEKYPLLTSKYFSYKKFKEALNILENCSLSYKEKNELIEKLIMLNLDIYNFRSILSKCINKDNIREVIYKE